MRVICTYVADDGRRFDDRTECEDYELRQRIGRTSLRIYREGELLDDPLSQDTYNGCTHIEVPDDKALDDLRAIYGYAGFYGGIDSTGRWEYDDLDHVWVKVS